MDLRHIKVLSVKPIARNDALPYTSTQRIYERKVHRERVLSLAKSPEPLDAIQDYKRHGIMSSQSPMRARTRRGKEQLAIQELAWKQEQM